MEESVEFLMQVRTRFGEGLGRDLHVGRAQTGMLKLRTTSRGCQKTRKGQCIMRNGNCALGSGTFSRLMSQWEVVGADHATGRVQTIPFRGHATMQVQSNPNPVKVDWKLSALLAEKFVAFYSSMTL